MDELGYSLPYSSPVFVVPLSVSGTAVALADIASDLGADPIGQQWALNGFNATFAASTLAWGSLANRIGRWRSFQIGGLIFIAASVASFLAPNYIPPRHRTRYSRTRSWRDL